jgi:outer membrane receptor protein involved in Fe transport
MKFLNRRFLASTAIIGAMVVPTAAFAQLSDEIVVTAQKRESTLQDTPIAVSAVTADSLDDTQVRDVRDLVVLVPSLNVAQFAQPSATTISIRGIGTSGFNAGLEPSVGVFVNGVYRSKAGAALNDYIAVERIEILRGPQSTLYGKNTPAGVVSVITKKPQYDFGAEADFTYGNYNQIVARGTVTGPIGNTEKVAFRLSGNYNSRDGFTVDDTTGTDINNRNRYSVRGQLLFEPTDNLNIRLIGDFSNLDERCCGATPVSHAPGPLAALLNLGGPLTNPLPGGTPNLLNRDPFDRHVALNFLPDTVIENHGFSGEINYDFGGATFTSITAYRGYDEDSNFDADFTDADLVESRRVQDDFTAFSQEFRLTSNGSGNVDWMIGSYYFNQDLHTNNRTTFGIDARTYADNLSALLTGGAANLSAVEGLFLLGQAIGLDTNAGQTFTHGPITPGTFFAQGTGLGFDFNQNTSSFSGFGSFDWHATDKFTITTGLRYTSEDKDVTGLFTTDDVFSSLDLNNLLFLEQFPARGTPLAPGLFSPGPLPRNAFAGFGALQPFIATSNFTDTRNETKVTGNVIFSYNFSDWFNGYASFSRGFKSGGFNLSQATTVTGRDFASETMDNYELGWKAKLFDNRVQFNGAIFQQTLTDFQSNTFNGISFDLSNAGSVGIDGVEFDFIAQPIESLFVTFGGAYIDATYNEFLTGPSIVGSASPITDLSGERLPGVSKWTMSSTATYTMKVGSYEAFLRGEAYYKSGQNLGTDLNPLKEIDDFLMLSASAGISDPNGKWNLSVWGKNINDVKRFQGLFDTVFQAGSISGYPIDPPTYGVTLRVRH